MQHVSVHASIKINIGSLTFLDYTTGKLHIITHTHTKLQQKFLLFKSQENANDSFSFWSVVPILAPATWVFSRQMRTVCKTTTLNAVTGRSNALLCCCLGLPLIDRVSFYHYLRYHRHLIIKNNKPSVTWLTEIRRRSCNMSCTAL